MAQSDEIRHVEATFRPRTAWPTVCLAIFGLAVWTSSWYLVIVEHWKPSVTLLQSVIAVYLCFTPLHDSVHRSVSQEHRMLNELVGWCCSIPFMVVPFPIFRLLHLRHHKYTNDPALDPDHLPDVSPLLIPIQIILTVFQWLVHLRENAGSLKHEEIVHSCLHMVSIVLAIIVGIRLGHLQAILLCGVVPFLLATIFLGFCFSYLPHRPHTATRRANLYACTSTLDGFIDVYDGDSSFLLTVLLLGQNFHSIHHIFPTLPFYTYASVWRKHKAAFLKKGVPLASFLQFPRAK
eukprot:TRINITY_DN27468_c0_g3_i1.p1 TRINITY_DN27468_c0_g3~~TRINITY_DN27468_c0_g3_i1.p1  ORF type:complete len:292 (+),score=8.67 TRINITY_DN27468_c0_g3_i1:72-947(+)